MVWDPGFGIQDPGYGKNLFRIPDPGVKKAPDPGSRIRNTATQPFIFTLKVKVFCCKISNIDSVL